MPAILLTVLLIASDSFGVTTVDRSLQGLSVQRITVSAIEAKTATVPLSFDGQQVAGQIKGTLTVTQNVDIDEGQFADLEDLRVRLRQLWCPPSFVPHGEMTFSAGRNVSADLGIGSLIKPVVARIDLTYRRDSDGHSQPLTIYCTEKRIATCTQKTCRQGTR